jgi:hypothetical protein
LLSHLLVRELELWTEPEAALRFCGFAGPGSGGVGFVAFGGACSGPDLARE